MRKLYVVALVLAALTTIPAAANAQVRERTLTGAAIGAGAGAVIAGPAGAVVGGLGGAFIGGPRVTPRHCWRDRYGYRHCRY